MPRLTDTGDRRSVAVIVALLVVGLTAAHLAAASIQGNMVVPPGGPPLTGSITLTDRAFICRGALALKSLTVTIDASSPTRLAVQLGQGCTGSIGTLNVHQYLGDGVDVTGASNLNVNGGTITCSGRSPGFHQDGIQAMNGDHVTFTNMTVDCATSSNSGFYVNAVTAKDLPSYILFTHGTIEPAGSSTAFVNQAVGSGVEYSTLYPSRYFTYRQSSAAVNIGNVIR
jgi:hypothetical protein